MEKINFIKTFIPEGQYRQKYEYGNMVVYHINAEYNKEMNAYECYECTLPIATLDETKVRSAFAQFSAKLDALKLEEAKAEKIAEITDYDTSDKVNGFILNGMLIPWSKNDPNSPNVEKRMGLRQNIADKVALGEENIAIWLKGMSFTMPCAQAEVLMRSIENYAYECFNVTASHKQAVSELTTIEEVEAYDYKAGYPKMLEMSV